MNFIATLFIYVWMGFERDFSRHHKNRKKSKSQKKGSFFNGIQLLVLFILHTIMKYLKDIIDRFNDSYI